jgi:hypothetical protein
MIKIKRKMMEKKVKIQLLKQICRVRLKRIRNHKQFYFNLLVMVILYFAPPWNVKQLKMHWLKLIVQLKLLIQQLILINQGMVEY